MKDVDAGLAFVLPGGKEKVRQRWRGACVVAGRLGAVHAPGQNPRLIGDAGLSFVLDGVRYVYRSRSGLWGADGLFFSFVRVVGWRACFIDSFVDGYGGVQASGKWIGIKICTQQHGWWQLAVEKWMHIAFSMG